MAASTEQMAWVARVLDIDASAKGEQSDLLAAAKAKAASGGTKDEPGLSSDPITLVTGTPPGERGDDHAPGRTPPEKLSEFTAPTPIDQTVVWTLPGLTFGAALSTLPPAMIVEGNFGAQITYEPALDATVPPVGTMTIFVSIPGNAAFNPVVRRPSILTVGVRPLVLTVLPAEMAAGGTIPQLRFTAQSLAPSDAITVAFSGAPDVTSAPKTDGYPVAPVVTFTQGDAANYAVTLVSGMVVVTRSFDDMDAEITRLRHGFLALPGDGSKDSPQAKLIGRLDDVEQKRSKREEAPAALETLLRELDRELYKETYVPVTAVKVAAVGGVTKIALDETIMLQATIEPANATEQGVTWMPDDPQLVDVSQTGQVSRLAGSGAGGEVVVRATSKSVEQIPGALTIEVIPKPESIEIDAPDHVFFNGAAGLTAQITPLGAVQDVTWTIISRSRDFVKLRSTGSSTAELTITQPPAHQKIASGTVIIQARSTVFPDAAERITIPFGGFAAKDILISLPRDAKFEVGAEVLVTARVQPDTASQDVEWSFSGGEAATKGEPSLDSQGRSTLPIKLTKPGQVEVTASTTDGTNLQTSRWFGARVPLESFTVDCPKKNIDLTESFVVTPVFNPPTAKCPVSWSSSDVAVLNVDKNGRVTPGKTGKATITATADGKPAPVEITVGLSDTAVLSSNQMGVMLPLIEAYAVKIGIKADDKTYQSYRYALLQDVQAGGRKAPSVEGAAAAPRVPLALNAVKADLITMRNKRHTKEHADWLALAGFTGGSGNCRTRECGPAALGSMTFTEAHLTLFDTKAQLPIGASSDALVSAVLREKLPEMTGLHLTAYALNKTEEMKVYNSGAPWSPKFELVAEWAERWDPNWQEAWQTDSKLTYKNYEFLNRVREELKSFYDDQIPDRINALKAAYDAVKQYDASSIG